MVPNKSPQRPSKPTGSSVAKIRSRFEQNKGQKILHGGSPPQPTFKVPTAKNKLEENEGFELIDGEGPDMDDFEKLDLEDEDEDEQWESIPRRETLHSVGDMASKIKKIRHGISLTNDICSLLKEILCAVKDGRKAPEEARVKIRGIARGELGMFARKLRDIVVEIEGFIGDLGGSKPRGSLPGVKHLEKV